MPSAARARLAAAAAAIGLSACAAPAPIAFEPDAGGIQLSDSPLRIDFGRARASAIESMSRLVRRDPAAQGRCTAGGRDFAYWRTPDRQIWMFFSQGGFSGVATRQSARLDPALCPFPDFRA